MNSASARWLVELEKRTQRARLLTSGADQVYESLRAYSQERVRWRYSTADEELESSLLARGEPVIDIALAGFAASTRIVAELWTRTRGEYYADPQIRKGIRLACLSNHTVLAKDFPASVVGVADLQAILGAENSEEAVAIITNDKVDETFLTALYERREPFAALEESAWRALVVQSRHNALLNGDEAGDFGPDKSLSKLHAAIFHLLETAPVSGPWVVGLHYLLDSLDPQQVRKPEVGRVGGVLARWATIEVQNRDGTVQGGVYPGLTYADEFRCLIAALYGGSVQDGKLLVHGGPLAQGIAERCAYYGNAPLTAEEVERFLQREPVVFAFAASCNLAVMSKPELRRRLEESASGRDFRERYLAVLEHYQHRWPQEEYQPIAAWLQDRAAPDKPGGTTAAIPEMVELDEKLERALAQMQRLERVTLFTNLGLIAIAILLLLDLFL